jgi:hypothetical protein
VHALVSSAEAVKLGEPAPLTTLEARLRAGCIFVVRDGDHLAAATTRPSAAGALVLHDLGACVRSLATAAGAPLEAADAPA